MATHTEHEDPQLAPRVLGVVVSVGRTPYLPGVLKSIAEQRIAPHRVALVDVSSSGEVEAADVSVLNDAGIDVQIVHAPRARTFGSAVSTGLNSIELNEQWLWLLHDDAVAHREALAAQLKPVEHTSSVSIVGAKQRKLGDGKELINVGYTASRAGTRFTGIESQEFDQGQHDSRDDVYAVSLNGALVSASAWLELKGTDPAFGKYGDSLDFCRRARLAGHRIIIEAQAVVEHAQADFMAVRDQSELVETPRPTVLDEEPAARSFWSRLTGSMLFGATNYSILVFPLILISVLLVAPLRMLYRLLTKAPRLALHELLAPFWLAMKLPAVIRLRSQIVRTKKVSAKVLLPLLASTDQIRHARRNRRLARTALRKRLYGPSDLDRREFRALARKRIAVLAIVIVVMGAATLYGLRDLMGAITGNDRLVGGAMLPVQGGWPELWQHWSSGWIRDGLGASAPSDPLLATLAPVMLLTLGNMQLAANVVMIGALLASAVGAWFAAGTVSRSVTARAWTALIWAGAPTMLFALEQGRMGAVIAHSALPWLALTIMRGLGLNKRDARGTLRFRHEQRQEEQLVAAGVVIQTPEALQPRRSLAAIGGAALIFAVIVAATPVLLLPGLIIFVLSGLFTRARALLFVPVPALALLGPVLFRGFVNRETGGWRVLFSDPGAAFAYEPSQAWQRMLGVPSAVRDVTLDAGVGQTALAVVPYVLGGALLVGALVSLIRRGPRAGQIRLAWWIAVLGLVTSLASSAIVIAAGERGPITGWSGAGISLMVLGLLAACLLASDEVAAAALTRSFGWRQVSLGVVTLAVFVLPIGTLAVWGHDRDIAHETVAGGTTPTANLKAIDRALVPAVAQQMQTSGRQARVLGIQPAGIGRISYQLMHGDGMQLMETSTVVDVAYLTGRPDDIAGLVAHLARGLEQEGHSASAYQLASMGVGAVLVPPGDSDEYAQLIARLDTVAGLQRITENETGTVWRVDPRVLDADQAYGEVSSVSARNATVRERAEHAAQSTPSPEDPTGTNPAPQEGEEPGAGEGSSAIELESTTVLIAGEPAWATTYVRGADGALGDPETLPARRLGVRTAIDAGPERTIVLAENAAPGWTATLSGQTLTSAQVNGMQAFIVPDGASGQLKIAYERSSRIAWLALQSVVLVAFGALAIPVRRKGTQKWA